MKKDRLIPFLALLAVVIALWILMVWWGDAYPPPRFLPMASPHPR